MYMYMYEYVYVNIRICVRTFHDPPHMKARPYTFQHAHSSASDPPFFCPALPG